MTKEHTGHTYRILLTNNEVATLRWMSERGYWPEEAYAGMHLADDEPEEVRDDVIRTWEIAEPEAWSISQLAETDEHAFLSCCGGLLVTKLTILWQSII